MVAPDRGDLVLITVERQDGESQRTPALVVSPERYNGKSGLALMCAIAQKAKGYPFEVRLPDGLPVQGVVLADHLRSADWKVRAATIVGRVPTDVVADVLAKLKPL